MVQVIRAESHDPGASLARN